MSKLVSAVLMLGFCTGAAFGSTIGTTVRIGIVDHRLLLTDDFIREWKADWESDTIAELFGKHGVQAEIIGADVLRDVGKLRAYRAIMIPTDHCYPEEGNLNGVISKAITEYVRSGGIYIMPMGASHYKWRDVNTGAIGTGAGEGQRDFLGLTWRIVGDPGSDGRTMRLTEAGEKAGIPSPNLGQHVVSYSRSIDQSAVPVYSYVDNLFGHSCLYAASISQGAVIHYTGWTPLDAGVRDWLIAGYAAILKSGPEMAAIHTRRAAGSRVYTSVPMADRSDSQELRLDGDWELSQAKTPFSIKPDVPARDQWTTVEMPNTIQYALYLAGKTLSPWWADNYQQLQWIQNSDWYLRRRFNVPTEWSGRQVRLRFDGIDYLAAVWLDGEFLGNHEGMFGGPTFGVSDRLTPGKDHEILVRLMHDTGPALKPLALNGWNLWGNRCRTIGLWQSVRLVSTGKACVEAPYVRTESIGKGKATLWAQAMIANSGERFDGTVRARITDLTTGKTAWEVVTNQPVAAGTSFWETRIELPSPRLWWPNGLGAQPLYRLELTLMNEATEHDRISTRFGVRTVELRRNPSPPGSPRSESCVWGADPVSEPLVYDAMKLSDESHRFLFVVNGIPFYANGTNWHTAEGLFAHKQVRQEWYVKAARMSGINLFRLNGGNALYEDEHFYNLCDESGILVWQDIHVTGGRGTDIPLSTWREQLTQTVLRLRQHPCLALYCGGNEYVPYRNEMMAVLGVARDVVASYDDRPFRMSSTGGGSWHYPHYDQPELGFAAEWHYAYGFTNFSQLKRVLPERELDSNPVGYDFTKFGDAHPLFREQFLEWSWLTPVYWPPASWYVDLSEAGIADFVEAQQMFRADCNAYAAEQMRSRFPEVGGQAFWGFNPQAPTSAWHVIDWFGQPQVAYYTMKRAHEPVHIQARVSTNWTKPGEMFVGSWYSMAQGGDFRASVCAVNSTGKSVTGARITARILDPGMRPALERSWAVSIPSGGVPSTATDISWKAPPNAPRAFYFFELTLQARGGERLSRQLYYFRVHNEDARALSKEGPWLKPQIQRVPTRLAASVRAVRVLSEREAIVTVEVRNAGTRPAYPVSLTITPDTHSAIWSDNYMWLRPGERVTVEGLVRTDMTGLDLISRELKSPISDLSVEVAAWNAEALRLGLNSIKQEK